MAHSPQLQESHGPFRRGTLSDIRLAAKKAIGLLLSGDATIFRSREARRRIFRKAKWLLIKHLGVQEIVLPFLNSKLIICARTDDDVIGCDIYLDGVFCREDFERAMLLWERSSTVNEAIFVDIGANIGTHSLYALHSGKFSTVVSIEPESRNFDLLLRNLLINGYSTKSARNVGLSSHSGSASLALSPDNLGDHRIVREGRGALHRGNTQNISLETFRVIQHELGLTDEQAYLFWIDTQGHEHEVCQGIGVPLLSRNVSVIEFWPRVLNENGQLQDMLQLLRESFKSYLVLQSLDGKFKNSSELEVLAEELLCREYPHDVVDILCVGRDCEYFSV